MESSTCDVYHLDSDVLLPPRKRLLAGLKRQKSDVNFHAPSTYSNPGSEFGVRLNNLLKSYTSVPNVSNEEIIETSRKAAVEAVKVAESARATAEEKAAKAAKAVAAAKIALELVATISEETDTIDTYLKKNKLKKHVPVQTLYSKQKGTSICRTDEELARTLHRVINSSPRISKSSSTSNQKSHKPKRRKTLSSGEKIRFCSGDTASEGNQHPVSYVNGLVGETDTKVSVKERNMVRVDLNIPDLGSGDQLKMESGKASVYNKADQLKVENGAAVHLQQTFGDSPDDTCSSGRKKGKLKQKKLPLSICNFRDKVNIKEDIKSGGLSLAEGDTRYATDGNKSRRTEGSSGLCLMSVEKTSLWKCQAFKAPTTIKHNKVSQL